MRNIKEILALNDAATIHTLLTSRKHVPFESYEDIMRQWDPYQHDVFDPAKRKKKRIKVPTDHRDPVSGQTVYKSEEVDRVRIAVPAQKVITERLVGFMLTNAVVYRANSHGQSVKRMDDKQQKLYDALLHCYHDNKMQYFDKKIVRTVCSQCEAAELWYMTTDENGRLGGEIRVQLLSPEHGDKLYPHFNDWRRMDGFGREYYVYDELGTGVLHFDVYTDRHVYKYINNGAGWALTDANAHGFTKIPIVYYRQDRPEWADVQWAIDRVEECISNWGDTNDYFGTPKYFIQGRLEGFAEKGEQGAIFQGGKETHMNVLSWDHSPESVKGEIAYLFNIIFSFTQTPDISFENMKTLGNNTSGAAIRLMFTDPFLKVGNKAEMYGEMFTRRSNIVVNGICNTGVYVKGIDFTVAESIDFEPVFEPYIPKNNVELLQLITQSNGGKASTSQRRSIELNPLNDDADSVEAEMKAEQEGEMARHAAILGTGGSAIARQSLEESEEE